ncbi:MAG TPA: hypothetical protein DHW14_00525 [Clostridiales bacterium]|nr:hypothetical protein [Clostridiales bacterium]
MGLNHCEGQPYAAGSLRRALERGRMAQAYLFAGPEGCGKRLVARELAKAVLCEAPVSGDACGTCRSCRLVESGSHPDVEFFRPEGGKASYPVRQLREEIRRCAYLKPALGPRRFIVIERAEALVRSSGARNEGADTLLKLLEEPAPQTCLVLLTSRPEVLPETVRSRCQLVRFRPPPVGALVSDLVREYGLEEAEARFAAYVSGGDPESAAGLVARRKERKFLLSLRDRLLSAARLLGTMSYPELFEAAAAVESHARDWGLLSGALGVLSLIYRDGALRGLGAGERVLAFPAGAEAEAAGELAGRHAPEVLVAAARRVLKAQGDARRYPARLLLLEVLFIDLECILRAPADRREGGEVSCS